MEVAMKFSVATTAVTALVFLCLAGSVFAQNLLYYPESVVFDTLRERWLVSNWGNGRIVEIDSNGVQSYFNTDLDRVCGLHIIGDMLYAASCSSSYIGVVGFDLETAQMEFFVDISGSGLVNDITSDTSGWGYATDYYSSRVYKFDPVNATYSVFVDHDLYMPNGIIFDASQNRLLTVMNNQQYYPLKAIDVNDSSVSVVVNTYLPGGADGIVIDNEGRTYMSNWTTNSVHRYDANFTNPPEVFSSGHSAPADIYFNARDNILAVPNFYRHTVDFVQVQPISVDDFDSPQTFYISGNYPNPFNSRTTVRYFLPFATVVKIDIYDVLGRRVEKLFNGTAPSGGNNIIWNAGDKPSGIYFCRIQSTGRIETHKMTLVR
jgi:sugar lactone lactonase YvrE